MKPVVSGGVNAALGVVLGQIRVKMHAFLVHNVQRIVHSHRRQLETAT